MTRDGAVVRAVYSDSSWRLDEAFARDTSKPAKILFAGKFRLIFQISTLRPGHNGSTDTRIPLRLTAGRAIYDIAGYVPREATSKFPAGIIKVRDALRGTPVAYYPISAVF